ncbi:MAG: peptidoglycan DD-metalloendopeptidase family protein [Parabacteroides sp.]|nr:peptidoglycan DD-metalloendopeptidase family protein [Parabacteroides sp.]
MRYVWIVLLALSLSTGVYGQKSAAVRQLEQQRKEALADIEETNKLLRETAQTAKTSLNRLNLLSKQIFSRKKVISLLNQELDEIEKDLLRIQGQLRTLKRELGDKQTNYGKSMRGLYKRHSSQDKLLFILSAESFSQSMRRMRYLREYADWQKRQANDILEKQAEISRKQAEMEKARAGKRALLGTRQEESRKLEGEEASQKEEVQSLNKKQKSLKADLQKKRRQAEVLDRQIEKQIAEEIARAEAEAKAARERAERAERERVERERRMREKAVAKGDPAPPKAKEEPIREERVADTKGGYAMTKAEKQLSDNFANNRGRLPYPVAGRHTIVATFGEQQHQELKYVRTSNSGIDIQTSPGADARAVFNGEVTRVFVVPGYNNSVIVRHGNYLTVYSNLSQVYVKAGDRVSTRQAIGRIYSDPEDGNSTVLHFQLWKEKTKLNPQPWLE